jgi:hypothetical protein
MGSPDTGPTRGDALLPLPRTPSYPPRRPRFPGPRMTCTHCGLASETTAARCPVCDAAYPGTRLRRAIARLRRTQ